MRKVTAIACIDEADENLFLRYSLLGLHVVTNTGKVISFANILHHPCGFSTFRELYVFILNTLKYNNMYVEHWEDFDSKWYNIQFQYVSVPYVFYTYPLTTIGENNE